MNLYHVSLSSEEQNTLEQMYQFGPKRRLRQRAHMLLLSNQGYSQKEVAKICRTSYPTARRYIHGYDVYGLMALYDGDKPGRRPRLSQSQIQQVDQSLGASPRVLGYNQSNWTARLMRYHVKKTWGITLSWERIRQIIKACGYVLVRPRHKSRKIDPVVKKKAQADLQNYIERAQQGEIRLFFCDEIKLRVFATLTRMWVKKGRQAEIPVDDNHDSCYGYAAIDSVSLKTHYRMAFDFNSAEFRRFVTQLTTQYPDQHLVLVIDNAPPHGYPKQHGEVRVTQTLSFYFLPPYTAIELNPMETVFRFFRHRVTHNQYFAQITDLIEAARNFFRYLYTCRSRVASLIEGKVQSSLL